MSFNNLFQYCTPSSTLSVWVMTQNSLLGSSVVVVVGGCSFSPGGCT